MVHTTCPYKVALRVGERHPHIATGMIVVMAMMMLDNAKDRFSSLRLFFSSLGRWLVMGKGTWNHYHHAIWVVLPDIRTRTALYDDKYIRGVRVICTMLCDQPIAAR